MFNVHGIIEGISLFHTKYLVYIIFYLNLEAQEILLLILLLLIKPECFY